MASPRHNFLTQPQWLIAKNTHNAARELWSVRCHHIWWHSQRQRCTTSHRDSAFVVLSPEYQFIKQPWSVHCHHTWPHSWWQISPLYPDTWSGNRQRNFRPVTVKFPHTDVQRNSVNYCRCCKQIPRASLIFGKEMWPNKGSHSMHNMSGVWGDGKEKF